MSPQSARFSRGASAPATWLAALALCAGAFVGSAGPVISEFMADNTHTLTNKLGKTSDWIELFNDTSAAINLAGWRLTDDAANPGKWTFPSTNIAAGGFLLVYASGSNGVYFGELHANFKLAKEGGYLGLARSNLTVACAYTNYPPQDPDVSYGIGAGGALQYFPVPTPGASNVVGLSGFVADTKFTPDRGQCTNAVAVAITTAAAGAQIYYTRDGTAPTTNNALYTGPIPITNSTVLRAAAFKTGEFASDVDTHSYLFPRDTLGQPADPPGFPAFWTNKSGVVTPADYAMDTGIVNSVLYGPAMTQAVRSLPFLSIVTAKSNLFDAATGIYANPTETGILWERAASAEYVLTNNGTVFGANCGLRIQGTTSRSFATTRKKAFTLRFRAEYGPGRLDGDLFDDPAAASSFNDLVVRSGAYDVWSDESLHARAQYLRNEFAARTQRAMGSPSPHGTFTHVYLDGLYWGLYTLTEKVTGDFAAGYFGGDADNWDVFVNEWDQGDSAAFYALLAMVNAGPVSNAVYQKIQGNNPDRSRNPAYPVYFDPVNYIDYVLLEMWYGNRDWIDNKLCMMRNRDNATSTGFKWCVWDSEAGMTDTGDGGVNLDMTARPDPTGLRASLMGNAEFRLQFADRIQKHLFNGGALTPASAVARYRELADRIEPALAAESARWGDQDGKAAHTPAEWRTERDWLLNTYLPQRAGATLQQFRNAGLYPAVAAPEFDRPGGVFTNGFALTMTATNAIYYTLDGRDPREYGSGKADGTLYSGPVVLPHTVHVKARAMAATNQWSALNEALFVRDAPATLRVTELMYNPRGPQDGELGHGWTSDDFEFIEVRNSGTQTVGLAGVAFTEGVTFDFTDCGVPSLGPGEYAVVVRNAEAFRNRYAAWPGITIAGAFRPRYDFEAPRLADAGERVVLKGPGNETLASFTYADGRDWPLAADGAGHSLVPLAMGDQAGDALEYGGNWRASAYRDGSPGRADPAPVVDVVVNEVMAHTDYTGGAPWQDSNDWIELYNASTGAVSLNGWYLSDDAADLKKWAIPATNTIGALCWRTFYEVGGFHPATNSGFGLNKAGDAVYVSYLAGGANDRVADCVRFKGQENGVTWGRHPDGGGCWYALVPTANAANARSAPGVVIAEIMYHPAPTAANPEDNTNDEYVELYNTTDSPVALWNATGCWRLDGGVAYAFPSNTTLAARGVALVVSFDPASDVAALNAFLAAYGLTNGEARLFGPYQGKLSNVGDRVALERPQAPDLPGDPVSWVIVDEAVYFDEAPWPARANGSGAALSRLAPEAAGNDPANWSGGSPTPGHLTSDEDGDGMADMWERMHFGGISSPEGGPHDDKDGDGMENFAEFVAGTDPTNRESVFELAIAETNGESVVRFPALRSAGPGCEGLRRYYDLEVVTNLTVLHWEAVEGATNLPGEGLPISYTNSDASACRFFRVRVRLE